MPASIARSHIMQGIVLLYVVNYNVSKKMQNDMCVVLEIFSSKVIEVSKYDSMAILQAPMTSQTTEMRR